MPITRLYEQVGATAAVFLVRQQYTLMSPRISLGMQTDLSRQSFYLGPWHIQPMLNRMEGASGTIVLEPRLMRMLVYLVEHAGAVVSRDELMEAVWEGTIISESSLTSSISELRRLLQDDPQNPRFIETIRKRGYRLVASFTLVDEVPVVTPAPLSMALRF